jgi:hypothetical protein
MIDELALLRAADPAAAVGRGPLDARAMADLERIMSLDVLESAPARGTSRVRPGRPLSGRARRHLRSRRRAVWIVALAAVVAAVVAGLVVVDPWGVETRPAYAATPKVLALTSVPAQPLGTLADGLARAAATRSTGASTRGSSYEQWALNSRIAGQVVRSAVVPREVDLRWNADASGRERVVVGHALTADATTGLGRPTNIVAAGTVLMDNSFAVGGYTPTFAAPPPASVAALRKYLAVGHSATGGSAELFAAVTDLRLEWQVNGPARAALLQLLGHAPGVMVLGAVHDRLGRPGLALATDSSRSGLPTRYVLVIDPKTGNVIDSEQWLTTTAGKLDVRIPSVIAYTAFR